MEADGDIFEQSLAIILYLDEIHPQSPLLPAPPRDKAKVLSFASAIACDIHPLNNLRVLRYLEDELEADEIARQKWYEHWIREGFVGLEAQLQRAAPTRFCFGDEVSLADVFLVPQMFNARRFNVDLDGFPRLVAIDSRCQLLPAFAAAHPSPTK
jgi:maleylacetoacetate isomerase